MPEDRDPHPAHQLGWGGRVAAGGMGGAIVGSAMSGAVDSSEAETNKRHFLYAESRKPGLIEAIANSEGWEPTESAGVVRKIVPMDPDPTVYSPYSVEVRCDGQGEYQATLLQRGRTTPEDEPERIPVVNSALQQPGFDTVEGLVDGIAGTLGMSLITSTSGRQRK